MLKQRLSSGIQLLLKKLAGETDKQAALSDPKGHFLRRHVQRIDVEPPAFVSARRTYNQQVWRIVLEFLGHCVSSGCLGEIKTCREIERTAFSSHCLNQGRKPRWTKNFSYGEAFVLVPFKTLAGIQLTHLRSKLANIMNWKALKHGTRLLRLENELSPSMQNSFRDIVSIKGFTFLWVYLLIEQNFTRVQVRDLTFHNILPKWALLTYGRDSVQKRIIPKP